MSANAPLPPVVPGMPPPEPRRVNFEELAGGGREVLIQFSGQTYRLLVTRNGKLILNK